MRTATSENFKALVDKSRAAGRLDAPAEPEQKKTMEYTGMRLWPEELARADELAAGEERSRAFFLRKVYLLGLDAYMAGQKAAPAAH